MKILTAVLTLAFLLCTVAAFGQTVGDFRSHQTGNWNDVNSWERFDGAIWVYPAPNTPTSADGVITIQTGHSISVTADTTVDQVYVAPGGTVNDSTGVRLTIADGPDAIDMSVDGTLLNGGTITPTGVLAFGNGGFYKHVRDGGSIPTATWNSGSTCELDSVKASAPSNGNQNFYNVIWNCPAQSGSLNMGWNGITVGGNITVQSTGSGRWQMCAPAVNTAATVNIADDVIQMGGQFTTNGTSNAGTTITINQNGNIIVTGGNFSISRGGQGGTGTTTWNLNSGNFSMSNATTQNSNAAGAKFVFAGSGPQILSLGAGNTLTSLPIKVNSGATLDIGTSVLSGSGIFALDAGATLETANLGGLDSAVKVTGTKTLSKAASYIFNGVTAQVTGTSLPDTVNNLTVNNAAGLTLSSGTTVNGVLTFTNGNIATSADTLRISSAGIVSRTSGHVVGELQKYVPTGSAVAQTFEIGSGINYTPVSVTFATVNTAGDVTASTVAGDHPNIGTSGINPSENVNRYWSLGNAGVGFTTCDAVLNFVPTDLDPGADPSIFIARKYDGVTWSGLTVGSRTATSLQALGFASFSDFAIGQPPAATVTSNGTGGGDWASVSTWQGGAVPTSIDSVVISGTDSVYALASNTCSGLMIAAGGKLALAGKLSLTNVTVNGSVIVQGDTLRQSGIMTVGSTGVYRQARDGGRIPTATWDTGSTFEITGIIGAAPSNGNQNFYNVVWNCPAQTANLSLTWDSVTIGGNVTVASTGVGRWYATTAVTGDSSIFSIMGDLIVSGGAASSNGTGNANTKLVINQYGNIIVTAGNFSVSRGSQGSGTGSTRWYLHGGNFSMSNATTQNSNPTNAWFVFDKAGTQTLTLGSGNTLTSLPIVVMNGTTLDMGVSQLRGSGLFTLNAGATLATANPGGLDSAVLITGTKTLSNAASFAFNGTAAQVTGISLPDTVNNLTVNNGSGVTLSGGTMVNGLLSVSAGHLHLNGDTITIGPLGSLHETPGNTVTGPSGVIMATRVLTTPSDTVDIAGLGIKIGSPVDLGSTVLVRGHGAQTAGGGSILRWFDISPTNNTGLNAKMGFRFDASELNGAARQTLKLFRSTDAGATWAQEGGAVDTATNVIALTGINAFSRWTAASVNPPPLPAQVVLISPSNGVLVTADTVVCTWNSSTPAVTNYWFEQSSDSTFAGSTIDSTITDTSVVSRQLATSHTYWWRVRARNVTGWGPFSVKRSFNVIISGVADGSTAPLEFSLKQNYPNPFNPSTTIVFSVEHSGWTTLEIYNILGQKVRVLLDGEVQAGKYHVVQFNAQSLPSGMYFYRLQSGKQSDLKKLLLLK